MRQVTIQSVTKTHNFTFSLAAVSAGSPPCNAAYFEVNSEPHTGARPSVRLCVGLIIFFPLTSTLKLKVLMLKSYNSLSRNSQDHKLKSFIVPFEAFNLFIQERYDVDRVAHDLKRKTPRSYLKPTQRAWFTRVFLIWSTSTSPDQQRVLQNFQSIFFKLYLNFPNIYFRLLI
jgi:hypothetical protein